MATPDLGRTRDTRSDPLRLVDSGLDHSRSITLLPDPFAIIGILILIDVPLTDLRFLQLRNRCMIDVQLSVTVVNDLTILIPVMVAQSLLLLLSC